MGSSELVAKCFTEMPWEHTRKLLTEMLAEIILLHSVRSTLSLKLTAVCEKVQCILRDNQRQFTFHAIEFLDLSLTLDLQY